MTAAQRPMNAQEGALLLLLSLLWGGSFLFVGVAVRDAEKSRPGIDESLLSGDAMALAHRDDLDVLVELAGGVDPAR